MADQRAKWTGNKLLDEIEEVSLNKILTSLRAHISAITLQHQHQQHQQHQHQTSATAREDHQTDTLLQRPTAISRARKSLPIPGLDELSLRHQKATGEGHSGPVVSVSGRYFGLVYRLVATLLAPPLGKAVVVVDAEGRFEVRRLLMAAEEGWMGDDEQKAQEPKRLPRLGKEDLKHLYVYKLASREEIRAVMESVEGFMLYGSHNSGDREWWGTVVIGGDGFGDVACGWKGWLRVEKEGGTRGFGEGVSVEEALEMREERWRKVEEKRGRWWGRSRVGDIRLS